jgi:ribulose-5-phosphate 4-epimerase/fuculose-1-phosphate aldolase
MPTSSNWPKAIIKAKRESEKHGWTWKRLTNGHYSVFTPDGEFVVSVSGTFYDGPLTRKYLGKLRKAGCPGVQ